jgi:diguanylate cyclase (GGDEF)-like protein
MAMLVILDPATTLPVKILSAGKGDELLADVKSIMSTSDGVQKSMVGQAISAKSAVISNNIQFDSRLLFREPYTEAGVRSLSILPLIISDEVVGTLVLYASEIDFFLEDEMRLLTGLASDIAFAIDHIDKQDRLNYLAYYDELTGLANRILFHQRLEQSLANAKKESRVIAVILLDIERFKIINDTLGRAAGDKLLKKISKRMLDSSADASRLARLDADHFAVLVQNSGSREDVARLIKTRILEIFTPPFRLGESELRITAKFGIAMFPDDGPDADTLLKVSEVALKRAKATGEQYLFYIQEMDEAAADKLAMENLLRKAIDNEEFVLYYQPKVNMVSGKVTSAEALLRWNDPNTGLVPPGTFIPILEETGMVYQVGRWALREAAENNKRWRAAGLETVRIAVNVSPLQLRNSNFVDEIKQVIALDRNAATGLELEITESMIMDNIDFNIATLQAIRALGVTIAIDDFGTGFSSLSYLARLPADTLKIDRAFVTAMTSGPVGLSLISTIISLAHAMKLKVVAEGVETDEQSRLLRLLGCDEIQGFLFSKPVPAEYFAETFLTPMSAE